jgi:hypothetical protein
LSAERHISSEDGLCSMVLIKLTLKVKCWIEKGLRFISSFTHYIYGRCTEKIGLVQHSSSSNAKEMGIRITFFADDLAADAVTSIRLQGAINCVQEFCKEWKLMINIEKTKIAVFKERGKLSKNEKRRLGTEE